VTGPVVALVSLGRDGAKGELRRVASWKLLFEAAGARVEPVTVRPTTRPHPGGLRSVLGGRAAPERLAWSARGLMQALDAVAPQLVVVVSARAFDPCLSAGPWAVILDFVDSLSRSYRDRATLVEGGLRRPAFRGLSLAHERLEQRLGRSGVRTVAAGWADARRLNAEWVPILTDPDLRPLSGVRPDVDVLFFGTLRYPPNVDALERLARLWPTVLGLRPGTTALVAGSAPTPRVRELCAAQGWEVVADFASLPVVAARARVAVAPLTHTAGIQIKVLDAAALGLPQVVRSPALAGLDLDFPLVPRDGDEAFAAEIVRLLENPDAARGAATAVRAHVTERYGVDHWKEWALSSALSAISG